MNELKPIPDWPGYSITRDSRFWSDKSNRWLKTRISKNLGGRLIVGLRRNGQQHVLTVHRLLLETFVGPCPEGMECRHLDGNRLNNDLDNLKWDTHYINIQDKLVHGTTGCGGRQRKLTVQQIIEIRQQLSCGIRQKKLATYFQVSQMTISNVNTRKIYT